VDRVETILRIFAVEDVLHFALLGHVGRMVAGGLEQQRISPSAAAAFSLARSALVRSSSVFRRPKV